MPKDSADPKTQETNKKEDISKRSTGDENRRPSKVIPFPIKRGEKLQPNRGNKPE